MGRIVGYTFYYASITVTHRFLLSCRDALFIIVAEARYRAVANARKTNQ
jgi:hypothetical protein